MKSLQTAMFSFLLAFIVAAPSVAGGTEEGEPRALGTVYTALLGIERFVVLESAHEHGDEHDLQVAYDLGEDARQRVAERLRDLDRDLDHVAELATEAGEFVYADELFEYLSQISVAVGLEEAHEVHQEEGDHNHDHDHDHDHDHSVADGPFQNALLALIELSRALEGDSELAEHGLSAVIAASPETGSFDSQADAHVLVSQLEYHGRLLHDANGTLSDAAHELANAIEKDNRDEYRDRRARLLAELEMTVGQPE